MQSTSPVFLAAGMLLGVSAAVAATPSQSLIPPSVQPYQSGPAARPTPPAQPAPAGPPAQAGAPASSTAPPSPAQPTHLSRADQAFVVAAAQSTTVQLQDAQLAAQRAASPRVKQLAQRLVTDQTAANDALQEIAQQANLTLPTQSSPTPATPGRRLTTLYGASFDSAFVNAQVLHDQQAIGLYQQAARTSRDPALKDFAQQTLSALRQHLALARSISSETAAGQSTWHGQD